MGPRDPTLLFGQTGFLYIHFMPPSHVPYHMSPILILPIQWSLQITLTAVIKLEESAYVCSGYLNAWEWHSYLKSIVVKRSFKLRDKT